MDETTELLNQMIFDLERMGKEEMARDYNYYNLDQLIRTHKNAVKELAAVRKEKALFDKLKWLPALSFSLTVVSIVVCALLSMLGFSELSDGAAGLIVLFLLATIGTLIWLTYEQNYEVESLNKTFRKNNYFTLYEKVVTYMEDALEEINEEILKKDAEKKAGKK